MWRITSTPMSLWISPSHEGVFQRQGLTHVQRRDVSVQILQDPFSPPLSRCLMKEDVEEEDSREDEEVKPFFCRKPPEGPTESETREHEVTQARAADRPHKVQVDKEHRYPEIHCDFCF